MGDSKNRYIIATIKSWNIEAAKQLAVKYHKGKVKLITDNRELSYSKIKRFNPRYIFFPHWSWSVPRDVYEKFKCVGFHMTDLPFGRGGSPLQNLIVRGITRTKISAIKIIKELDAGPVYLKRSLLLNGSAEDIYKRATSIIFNVMIPYVIKKEPIPSFQKGKAVIFKRRKPKESRILDNIDLEGIYDYIRMLDAEGYPPAFIETENLRFEFTKASKKNNYIEAKVHIVKKKEEK